MEKHFTVNIYIVSKLSGEIKVLLHRHKKLNIWLGPGGHVEKDENPVEASIREVKEETGLDIEFINKDQLFQSGYVKQVVSPFAIMEEGIPPGREKGWHHHIDFIYFATTSTPYLVQMQEEYGWFSEGELAKMDLEEDVRYLSQKAIECYKR